MQLVHKLIRRVLINNIRLVLLAISFFLLIIFLCLSKTNVFNLLDKRLFDFFNKIRNETYFRGNSDFNNNKVIIVNIDEDFIRKVGVYPLPRKYYAFMLEKIKKKKAKAIGISIFFENEEYCDTELQKFFDSKIVTGSIISENKNELMPCKNLCESVQTGFLNVNIDDDGLLRRIKPYLILNDNEVRYHFILKLLNSAFPNYISTNGKNIFIHPSSLPCHSENSTIDCNSLTRLDESGFYLDLSMSVTDNIEQINYVDFFNKYLDSESRKSLENCVVIIGVNIPGISTFWTTNGFNLFSSNYILAAGFRTLLKGNIASNLPQYLNIIYLLILTFIFTFLLTPGLKDKFTNKRIILISIIWLTGLIIPVLTFFIFSAAPAFFTVLFSYIIITGILLLLRYFIYFYYSKKSINAKIKAIRRLNELRQDYISELDTVKGSLLSNKDFFEKIEHEVRNPLMPIVGYCSYLLNLIGDYSNKEEFKGVNDGLKIIRKNANQIMDIFKTIKQISLIEEIQYRKEKNHFELNSWFENIKNQFLFNMQFDFEFSKRDISINLIFENQEMFVNADKRLLEILFHNLFDNSLKYSDKNDICNISIEIKASKDFYEFYYEDFGWGIDDSNAEKLFDKNYRNATIKNIGIRGNGIGLNLVKIAVETHNGSIEVKSKGKNEGLIFIIKLPNI